MLLAETEATDQRESNDAYSIPEELKRREDRLAAIAEAKAEIERRAEVRHQQEQAEYEEKQERRAARNLTGKAPAMPESGPRDKDQVKLTDQESRIMPTSGGGCEQAYNAQASVDNDSGLIVTSHVTQAKYDKGEIVPTLEDLAKLEPMLGKAESLLADAGYFSEANVNAVVAAGLQTCIAVRRDIHNQSLRERFSPDAPRPESDVTSLRWH